jgi:hypothetical protein
MKKYIQKLCTLSIAATLLGIPIFAKAQASFLVQLHGATADNSTFASFTLSCSNASPSITYPDGSVSYQNLVGYMSILVSGAENLSYTTSISDIDVADNITANLLFPVHGGTYNPGTYDSLNIFGGNGNHLRLYFTSPDTSAFSGISLGDLTALTNPNNFNNISLRLDAGAAEAGLPSQDLDFYISPVPEPSTFALGALGLVVGIAARRLGLSASELA